ncbi:MAG: zinc ribbon domain-containing protein [Pseudomonadota bacterium]
MSGAAWSKRGPERLYAFIMWIVSAVLAGFLISLGGNVIADLPRVEARLDIEAFVDAEAKARLDQRTAAAQAEADALRAETAAAEADVETERGNYQAAYDSFRNWLSTRAVTADPSQDPEVQRRTAALDVLKVRERTAERALADARGRGRAAAELLERLDQERLALFAAARPAFERAKAWQELRVFAFRLAVTLPLLIVAVWLTAKKRKSRYWPLMRGFVLFAAFAFFVELVPYLPSYGGYVRSGVGVLLTLFAGHYVIKWMRGYLENRQAAERKSEEERRKSLAYEDAIKKVGEGTCPGCDRKILSTGDVEPDFCVHCGMKLYDRCWSCDARKVSFYRYCMACGAPGAALATG